MADIGLNFVFDISVNIDPPRDGGPGRNGHRRIIPIAGGVVSGPRLNGRVLAGGADYELVRRDGCSVVTAHYAIEADDGAPIYVVNKGLFIAEPDVLARVDAGEVMPRDSYYFRSSPVFDAPEGPHVWLSDRIFVADCVFRQTDVVVRVYEVV